MACPAPVLRTKELIEQNKVSEVNVLVDNAAAKENVSRFLQKMGYEVQTCPKEGAFQIHASKAAENFQTCELSENLKSEVEEQRIAVLVGTDRMGSGDDVLGNRLIYNFISTLKEMGTELWRLIFLNGGVKLTVEGSECLSALKELQENGTQIMVCGTCLNHFGILEQKKVGETTNMLDIVTALQLADKIISIT